MKLLKRLLFVVVLFNVLLLVVSLFLPRRYRVERRVSIQAPPEKIFPYLNQLKRWVEWTAWTKEKDPTLEYAYSGPDQGVGSVQSWTAQSGSGSLTLTASDPKTGIRFDLQFEGGRWHSTGAITLTPEGSATTVIWANEGDLGWNPVGRYFGLLMDKMMGPDFATGLAKLKQLAEAPSPAGGGK